MRQFAFDPQGDGEQGFLGIDGGARKLSMLIKCILLFNGAMLQSFRVWLTFKYTRTTNEWISGIVCGTIAICDMIFNQTYSLISTRTWARINAFLVDANHGSRAFCVSDTFWFAMRWIS
jgi:hypothetical protein